MALGALGVAQLVLAAASIVLYAIVAWHVARRSVSEAAYGAKLGFALWWAGLAALGAFSLVFNPDLGISLIDAGLPTALGVIHALLLVIYAMMGGLVYYLLFLYIGKAWVRVPVLAFYAAMAVFGIWFIHAFEPCITGEGSACIAPEGSGDDPTLGSMLERPMWVSPVFGLALVLPPLVASMLYFGLFFKVKDATSKYRVALISGGILLWFAFSTLSTTFSAFAGAAEAGSLREDVTGLVSQALGVLSGTFVLLAYFPPKWAQRKWGVQRIQSPSPE